jgi:hypothetical protein
LDSFHGTSSSRTYSVLATISKYYARPVIAVKQN